MLSEKNEDTSTSFSLDSLRQDRGEEEFLLFTDKVQELKVKNNEIVK